MATILETLWGKLDQLARTKGFEHPEFLDAWARFDRELERHSRSRGIELVSPQSNGSKGQQEPFPRRPQADELV